jgi:predicted  nucleic acid-binding Zn-ribbon protein
MEQFDADHERRLTQVEQRAKSNTYRLEQVEARQDNLEKLTTSVEVLATKQDAIKDNVDTIKADVKTLTEKPGKRWDAVVDKLIWALLAAVLGFAAAYVGLS